MAVTMNNDQHKFDVVPQHEFNVSADAGQVKANPGRYYDTADLAWMMVSTVLVLLMVAGIGLLYSGTSRKSTIYMIWMPTITTAVVGLAWFFWGYAIAFSPSTSGYWGGTTGLVFHQVNTRPTGNDHGPQIPELVYALFHGMFACFTSSVVSGATIYKETTRRWIAFIVLWATFVYSPMAHSSWNPKGVANKWGALDFAGGTPVHISSGTSSLAYTLFYRLQLHRYNIRQRAEGRAENPAENWFIREDKEHVPTVVIGTILLWIGWFGFNGGSALGANMTAVSAIISTHLAACAGGVTGATIDYVYNQVNLKREMYNKEEHRQPPFNPEELELYRQKFLKRLVISFCNGAVAGMVAVTPAAGYISPYFAPIFGLMGSFCSGYAIRMSKHLFDTLDIFAIHGIAGFVGMLLTGIFASADAVALDGWNSISGGWIDNHWVQLGKQLADAVLGALYSFCMTFAILCILNIRRWRQMSLRVPTLVHD